ncbi:MAG: TRAM domain-containing protein [Anaerolineae bacterium]|nr:TRAM domain-containing protein [Anaerolineae bacterium]MCO5194461.1 TRAM domain-containing protein [Anaerolineae bacterium]
MQTETIKLQSMAHGGLALGRDSKGQIVFVPGGIPGERVRVAITQQGKRREGQILTIEQVARERVPSRCAHFGVCGGCQLQHIEYGAQLRFKMQMVADQLERVGKLKKVSIRPIIPHPQPYHYRADLTFSPTNDGRLGLWSPGERRVIPIDDCHIILPQLRELFHDIDLDLSDMRKLTLRIDDDDAVLIALEINNVEPPELAADIPVSVTILFPDKTAATLIGEPFLYYGVKGREFRVSSGCEFVPSPALAGAWVDAVLRAARLSESDLVVDAYSGVGVLTAFLADSADAVVGIDINEDAINDAAVNLENTDNVSLILDSVEKTLPQLPEADVLVIDAPSEGISAEALRAIIDYGPARIIYSSANLGAFARDARLLHKAGYRLKDVQPIDMQPQTYHIHTIAAWYS